MAGTKMVVAAVASTTYPSTPQLDGGGMRGSVGAVHMTPAGPAIFISFDGMTDAAKLDPLTPALSISFENPYYTKVWARLAAAGAASVQIILEGI